MSVIQKYLLFLLTRSISLIIIVFSFLPFHSIYLSSRTPSSSRHFNNRCNDFLVDVQSPMLATLLRSIYSTILHLHPQLRSATSLTRSSPAPELYFYYSTMTRWVLQSIHRQRRSVLEVCKYIIFLANRSDSCLLYTSPSPRDGLLSRMPSSA